MPPTTSHEALFVPDNIHPVLYYGGAVIMDTSSGRYEALNRPASDLLVAANETGSREAVHDRFIAQYADVPPDKVVDTVDRSLATIIDGGIVAVGEKKPPRQFGLINPDSQYRTGYESAVDMVRPMGEKANLTLSERVLGIRSLVRMARIMRQPFNQWTSELKSTRTPGSEDASYDQVLRCKEVISAVSSKWPGRVACLESAVAAALFGHARGLNINLQFGVALDPIRFHSWLEAPGDGRPVTLPYEERAQVVFHPIYKV